MNWISATGLRPFNAMPTAIPAMAISARGVSTTLSAPKRSRRPSVTRKTPPSIPTSSPRTTTEGSLSISPLRAWLRADTMFRTAITSPPPWSWRERSSCSDSARGIWA